MSLLDGEMRVIPMANGMVKPGKAIDVDSTKAMVAENTGAIANPGIRGKKSTTHESPTFLRSRDGSQTPNGEIYRGMS